MKKRAIRSWAFENARFIAVRSGPMPMITAVLLLVEPRLFRSEGSDLLDVFPPSPLEIVGGAALYSVLALISMGIALMVAVPVARLLIVVPFVRASVRRLEAAFKAATMFLGSMPLLLPLAVTDFDQARDLPIGFAAWITALLMINGWIADRSAERSRHGIRRHFGRDKGAKRSGSSQLADLDA